MSEPHIADAETEFFILNVIPDFCQVGDTVVPFDISQTLKPEKSDFAKSVFARGEPVIMVKSIINGVKGNAGCGVASSVSLGAGHSEVMDNGATVYVEGRNVARHLDWVAMNGIATDSLNAKAATGKASPTVKNEGFTKQQKKRIEQALVKQKEQLLKKKEELERWNEKDREKFKKYFGRDDEIARDWQQGRIRQMLELNEQYQKGQGKFTSVQATPLADPFSVQTAYVHKYDNKEIFITDKYWGTNESLTRVISHEMSHFAGTDDSAYPYKDGQDVYGRENSLKIAKKAPDAAWKHADTVSYWIEDQ